MRGGLPGGGEGGGAGEGNGGFVGGDLGAWPGAHGGKGGASCERGLGRRWSVSGAQIVSLGAAFRGLAGGFEGAEATAQDEGERPGPWLWQGGPCSAAAAEGGRRVNRLERTDGMASHARCPLNDGSGM